MTNNEHFTRLLHTKVKTAKRRKKSSTRWLERQLNDPYVQKAKDEGYRSRAVYKLMQIDKKYSLFKRGQIVIDLGAAPGSWSEYALTQIGSNGHLLGIDLLPVDSLAGAVFLQADFLDPAIDALINAHLDRPKVHVVMSDMASATTGHRSTDHLRTLHLCESAYYFARKHLLPDGHFIAKIFQGGTEQDLLQDMKQFFQKVRHVKPDASRKESTELYVVATGFKKTED